MLNTLRKTTLEKYHAMIKIDENTGRKIIDANAILSLSWQEYAELITMRNLPQVDHVNVEDFPSHFLLSWMVKDVPMKQTICIWLACSAWLMSVSIGNPHKLFPALLGLMSWVPIEYGYHRFIGHMPVVGDLTKCANFYLHGKHHFSPKDLEHVLLPPFLILIAAAAVYKFIFFNMTANPEMALAFTILHYLIYDTLHYAMHKFSLKDVSQIPFMNGILMRLWGNHERHHKEPLSNFLVTMGGFFKNQSFGAWASVRPVAHETQERGLTR